MGAVNTTYTFTATDTITSTKMNNIIDQTTVTDEAIIGTTLEVASGKLKIRSSGITSNEIGASSVTTNAIADGAVTPAKFSAGGPSWNSVTGTLNISQPQVEVGTGIITNTASLIDFHSVHPLTDYEARIIRYAGTNGGMAIEQTGSGGISITSPNGIFLSAANVPNPAGNAPIFGCRAWVNFNGQANSDLGGTYTRSPGSPPVLSTSVTVTATAHGLIAGNRVFLDFTVGAGTAPFDGIYEVASSPAPTANSFTVVSSTTTASTGTVLLKRKTIRANGNVSCVSAAQSSPVIPPTADQTVDDGYYIVNFSTAMPDANFAISGAANESGALTTSSGNDIIGGFGFNEKCAYVTSISVGSSAVDCLHNSVMVIR